MEAIKEHPDVRQECQRRLTVTISRFFRDRVVWQILEKEVLPEIMAFSQPPLLKVWSAGCACGEEVHSFSIMWQRLQTSGCALPDLSILATDLNPDCLSKAQEGIYKPSSLKHVSLEDRKTFFVMLPQENGFQIKPVLSRYIIWRKHQLLDSPPERCFHILFLRNNLLTYHQDPEKSEAFYRIADTIHPGGYLVIGAHEKLPLKAAKIFIQIPSSPLIFRKAKNT
jgi:chemotaxis methyl-accepting protein methylase